MANPSLREQVLQDEVARLSGMLQATQHAYLMLLTVLVHYIGGEVTLSAEDAKAAQGLLLTEEFDVLSKSRTFRTRRIGRDDDQVARGGLLPPTAGQGGAHDELN